MPPRVFISYRTSDGADKATALARELGAVFGDEQVFLDKEDLPAGQPWREAIGTALDGQPILLLLITPQVLGPRLQDADDPVRREVAAALEFGAHVIPLLGDGVERLPEAHEWPDVMRPLSERTWRRLRAYDWRDDVERLVADLQALGVPRAATFVTAPEASAPLRRRGLHIALAFAAGTLVGGGAVFGWLQRGGEATAAGLSGAWRLRVAAPANESGSRLEAVTLHLTQLGEDVKLYSEPIDITRDPAWTGFAQQWHERFGHKLERVVWRGAGRARLEQGLPPAIDVGLRVETAAGGDPIETGNLAAELAADGQRMTGRLWMNGEQAERSFEMARGAPD
jgi:TIR domain